MPAGEKCYEETTLQVQPIQILTTTTTTINRINNYHVEHLQRARNCFKSFTWINLFNLSNNPVDRYYYFCHFIDEKSLSLWQSRDAGIVRHPKSHHSESHWVMWVVNLTVNKPIRWCFISLLRNLVQLLL